MLSELEGLSLTEQDQVKRTIQDLLRHTCILQVKCDPATLEKRNNPRYQICAKYQDFLQDYLSLLGLELMHDPQENIYRIQGESAQVEKMSLATTRILLLLKLIYGERMLGEGLRAAVTNMAEIRMYGKDTNLLTRKLTAQEWQEAFRMLRTHQVVEISGALANMDDDTPILINNTVQLFCSYRKMNDLLAQYRSDEAVEGQEQFELHTQGKKQEEESGSEEDIYPPLSE